MSPHTIAPPISAPRPVNSIPLQDSIVGGGVITAVVVPVGLKVGLGKGVLLGNGLGVGVLLGIGVLVAVGEGPGLGV